MGLEQKIKRNLRNKTKHNTQAPASTGIFPKTFAMTAAQAGQNPAHAFKYGLNETAGAPNKEFLRSFDAYCKDHQARQFIQAIQGSYVEEIELHEGLTKKRDNLYMETARIKRLLSQRDVEQAYRDSLESLRESKKEAGKDSVAKEVKKTFFWDEIPDTKYRSLDFKLLNDKVGLVCVQTPSQNEDPIQGQRDLPQDYLGVSVIMPHSKQRFVSVPKDLGGKYPRVELTTGCCTHPNYNETNSRGKKATRHHQYGFAVVDALDRTTYLPRLVPATKEGMFVDLGTLYRPGKEPKKARTLALVLGDIHVPFQDPESIAASFDMIEKLKPEEVYLHDLVDFHTISHHNQNDIIWKRHLVETGKDSVERELVEGREFLHKLASISPGLIYVIPSNHDMFLYKWIAQSRYNDDPRNHRIGNRIAGSYDQTRHKTILEVALKGVGSLPSNVRFLGHMDDKRPGGYECASHGNMGVDGSRGNLRQYRTSYGKVIMGHTHSLEVDGHSFSAGTNSIIPLEYQKGQPSKSMRGNVAIYETPTGNLVQAIPIIRGKWRK